MTSGDDAGAENVRYAASTAAFQCGAASSGLVPQIRQYYACRLRRGFPSGPQSIEQWRRILFPAVAKPIGLPRWRPRRPLYAGAIALVLAIVASSQGVPQQKPTSD